MREKKVHENFLKVLFAVVDDVDDHDDHDDRHDGV